MAVEAGQQVLHQKVAGKRCRGGFRSQEAPMNTTTTNRRTYESLSEAAARTGMSIKTLRRRIACGQLTAYRSGRIIRLDPNDVDHLLAPFPTFPIQ
jgi:excisionase family DNA binding protein